MIESEAYSELGKSSKAQLLAKIVNGFNKLTIFKRNSILEISERQESEHASANIFQLHLKRTLYC